MTNHAKWPSGNHSRRLGGNNNTWSRSHVKKFGPTPEILGGAPDRPTVTQQPPRIAVATLVRRRAAASRPTEQWPAGRGAGQELPVSWRAAVSTCARAARRRQESAAARPSAPAVGPIQALEGHAASSVERDDDLTVGAALLDVTHCASAAGTMS